MQECTFLGYSEQSKAYKLMIPNNKIIIFINIIFAEKFVSTTTDYSKHANEDMDELLDASFFQTNTMPNSNPVVFTQQTVPL